jgi:hypothetical protein
VCNGVAAVYHIEGFYCLQECLSVNSTCRSLSPFVTNSQAKLAAPRQEFFLKPNLSYPKRETKLWHSSHFQGCPEAKAGRAVGITALQFVTAVLKWTLHSYLVSKQQLRHYKPHKNQQV